MTPDTSTIADERTNVLLHLASRGTRCVDLPWWRALTESATSFTMHELAQALFQARDIALQRGERFWDVHELLERRLNAICATLNDDDATTLRKLILAEFTLRDEAWKLEHGFGDREPQPRLSGFGNLLAART